MIFFSIQVNYWKWYGDHGWTWNLCWFHTAYWYGCLQIVGRLWRNPRLHVTIGESDNWWVLDVRVVRHTVPSWFWERAMMRIDSDVYYFRKRLYWHLSLQVYPNFLCYCYYIIHYLNYYFAVKVFAKSCVVKFCNV